METSVLAVGMLASLILVVATAGRPHTPAAQEERAWRLSASDRNVRTGGGVLLIMLIIVGLLLMGMPTGEAHQDGTKTSAAHDVHIVVLR
jgi:hypothetical protein